MVGVPILVWWPDGSLDADLLADALAASSTLMSGRPQTTASRNETVASAKRKGHR